MISNARGRPVRPLRLGLAMPGGFEFGGIGRMMLYASRAWALMEDGPEVVLVDPRGAGRILWMPLFLAGQTLRLASWRLTGRLDLLHINIAGRGSTLRKLALGGAAQALGLPTIVHLHDYDYAQDLAGRGPVLRRRVERLFRGARMVIVLGRRDRATVIRELGVPEERVVVLHNAVPDPGPPPDRRARQGPVQILFLGHLDERKGVPELLAALAQPALRQRSWRLVMAGGGQTQRFMAEVRTLGLEDRVSLPGWLGHEEVYELLRRADLFVLPSHAEGQAMSLLEAMAHGLAILTTPVGAHLEAVSDGKEALIVPPGEVDGLAAALLRLIDEPGLRQQLGQAARDRYREDFTVQCYASRLIELYCSVLAPRDMALS